MVSQESGFKPHRVSNPGKDQATQQLTRYGQLSSEIQTQCTHHRLQSVYQHVNPPEILQGNLSSPLHHIKGLNLVKTQQKNLREYVDFLACRT